MSLHWEGVCGGGDAETSHDQDYWSDKSLSYRWEWRGGGGGGGGSAATKGSTHIILSTSFLCLILVSGSGKVGDTVILKGISSVCVT